MAALIPVVLVVTDSSTNAPVQGANVFVDGSANFDPNQFTVVTDSNGKATFNVPSTGTNRLLQVTATNYTPAPGTIINTIILTPLSLQISLTPAPAQTAIINLSFEPQVAGILWSIAGPASSNGVTTPDGNSATFTAVPLGTYTITANLTGYQTLNTTLVATGQTDPYVFGLVADPDPTSIQTGGTSNSTALTSTPSSIVSQNVTQVPSQSEYIYPNSDYDKYFTIISARIYVGNLFIDECNTIQYALQDNAIPIYGYASRYADAYGQGRSLVQGQLTLNFVTEGYLYTVVKQYKQFLASTQTTGNLIGDSSQVAVQQVLAQMATRDSLTQQANNNPNGAASINAQAATIQSQITASLNSMTAAQVSQVSSLRAQQLTTFSDPVGFDNAVYQDVVFDIRIELGNPQTGVVRTRYLEKCKLISNEQVLDQSGTTILDSYGFIARRLR